MTGQILCGDALEQLRKLPSCSVQECITSPPYYQLRDYGADGQIGLENSVEEYIDKLVAVFHEVHRVLRTDGTLWVNIADSYAGSGKGPQAKNGSINIRYDSWGRKATNAERCKPKDMIGIPWLLALALRDDGWYLRQDIIWQKPNPMPESVTDRCTKAHEYLFLLSKSKQYYFDWAAIQEPCVGFDKSSPRGSKGTSRPNAGRRGNGKPFCKSGDEAKEKGLRRKRSVWCVATNGGGGKHYATFPKRLILPCILAGSRAGDTVLDPFAGSGTVGAAAADCGRGYVLIDLSPAYVQICKTRLEGTGHEDRKK